MPKQIAVAALGLFLLIASRALAADKPAVNLTFDQYTAASGATQIVELRPGQAFSISIAHGCPQRFDYSVFMSPAAKTPKATDLSALRGRPGLASGAPPENPASTVVKGPLTFEDRYGSYIVRVRKKAGDEGKKTCQVWTNTEGTPVDPPVGALVNVDFKDGGHWDTTHDWGESIDFTLAIEPIKWEIGEDAAFVFSVASDRKFAAIAAPGDATKKQIIEDVDGQGPGRFTFGSLTHFYLPRASGNLATGPTLGFSVIGTGSNQTEYYFGWGFGVGPSSQRLNLALGAALTPISVLPAGVKAGDIVADNSSLSNLRNVYRWRFFFAATATLFKTGNGQAGKPAAPDPGQ